MGLNCIYGCLDIAVITRVFAPQSSDEFSRVETKVDHGCTCHFNTMRVNAFLFLIVISGLAKQREIYFQPPYYLKDHRCKCFAHEAEVMKIL
jgi:hypothetical protein